jgi:hypothetical protein
VNADVSATRLDVALEIILLCRVEYIPRCAHEDYRAISREILRGERAGVFGGIDGESILLSELFDGGDSDRNGAMPEAGGLREDEDARLLAVGRDRNGKGSEKKAESDEALH